MIIRQLDELGRVCLPKEMRKSLEMEERQRLEIDLKNETIIIRKYEDKCTFCGSNNDITDFKEKKICGKCKEELRDE